MLFHHYAKAVSSIMAAMFICSFASLAQWAHIGDLSCILDSGQVSSGVRYVHPSNPFEAQDGTIMIFASGGQSEGENTHIGVWRKEGSNWVHYAITGSGPWYDPTAALADNGDIYCFYIKGLSTQYYKVSTDDGKTWGSQVTIGPEEKYLGEQNNPKHDADGTWMGIHGTGNPRGDRYFSRAPNDFSNPDSWEHVLISNEWGTGDILVKDPHILEGGRYKHLRAIMRSDWGGKTYAKSDDAGKSWTPQSATFSNPHNLTCSSVSPAAEWEISWGDATRTGVSLDVGDNYGPEGPLKGKHMIATSFGVAYCNLFGTTQSNVRGSRLAMAILTSETAEYDSWQLQFLVHTSGENADPGMIQASDRTVWVTYTGRGGRTIKYMQIDPDILWGGQLKNQKSVNSIQKGQQILFERNLQGLKIKLNQAHTEKKRIEIFDAMGNLVFKESRANLVKGILIPGDLLIKGFYTVRILRDNNRLSQKFVISE